LLGDAGLIVPPYWQIILFGLAAGLLIGLALVFTLKRKQA